MFAGRGERGEGEAAQTLTEKMDHVAALVLVSGSGVSSPQCFSKNLPGTALATD
jgi:hypothetical protein